MNYKCKAYHNINKTLFECYYCITDKLLEEQNLEEEIKNVEYAIYLIEIIKRKMV